MLMLGQVSTECANSQSTSTRIYTKTFSPKKIFGRVTSPYTFRWGPNIYVGSIHMLDHWDPLSSFSFAQGDQVSGPLLLSRMWSWVIMLFDRTVPLGFMWGYETHLWHSENYFCTLKIQRVDFYMRESLR